MDEKEEIKKESINKEQNEKIVKNTKNIRKTNKKNTNKNANQNKVQSKNKNSKNSTKKREQATKKIKNANGQDNSKKVEKKIVVDSVGKVSVDEVSTEKQMLELEKVVQKEMKRIDKDELTQEIETIAKEENIDVKEKIIGLVEKKRKAIIVTYIVLIAVILLLVLSTVFAIMHASTNTILKNVTINNIPVGGMTKEEALEKIKKVYEDKKSYETKFAYETYEYGISPEKIEFTVDAPKSVDEAYLLGRDKNILENNLNIILNHFLNRNVVLDYKHNSEMLEKEVTQLESGIPAKIVQPSYDIDEKQLLIYPGQEGNSLNKESFKVKVIETFILKDKIEKIQIPLTRKKQDPIDIEKIHQEVYKKPENASYDEKTKKVTLEKSGIDFAISIEEAKKIILEKKEEYIIPLKIIEAEKKITDLGIDVFPDLLGTFETHYNASNTNRTSNLKIATSKINGVILAPGEVFSYNKTLGKRTIDAGYKAAGTYIGGKVVDDVGGGICQVSSTLYNAALLSNLDIVSRTNHGFTTSYSRPGRDATVYYGAIDFKFKNTNNYPIKIVASTSNGIQRVSIYGINEEKTTVKVTTHIHNVIKPPVEIKEVQGKEPGYEKVISSGQEGYDVSVYREVFVHGVSKGKKFVSKDSYRPMAKVIERAATRKAELPKTETPKSDVKEEEKKPEKEEKQDEEKEIKQP